MVIATTTEIIDAIVAYGEQIDSTPGPRYMRVGKWAVPIILRVTGRPCGKWPRSSSARGRKRGMHAAWRPFPRAS